MTKLLTFLAWLAVLIMWGCAATVYVSAATYGKYIAVVGLEFAPAQGHTQGDEL